MIPCAILKGHEHLLAEEVDCYPDPSRVEPVLAAFVGVRGFPGHQLKDWLLAGFSDASILERERSWNAAQQSIVDGIRSLVANFPPKGTSYTAGELRDFIEMAGFAQVAQRQGTFVSEKVAAGEAVSMDAFPSVKANTYTVFYKFYADRTRQPSFSDAFDIIISCAIPHVDAIVTENHQAEALRKASRQDDNGHKHLLTGPAPSGMTCGNAGQGPLFVSAVSVRPCPADYGDLRVSLSKACPS
jgi:hypothetical protein